MKNKNYLYLIKNYLINLGFKDLTVHSSNMIYLNGDYIYQNIYTFTKNNYKIEIIEHLNIDEFNSLEINYIDFIFKGAKVAKESQEPYELENYESLYNLLVYTLNEFKSELDLIDTTRTDLIINTKHLSDLETNFLNYIWDNIRDPKVYDAIVPAFSDLSNDFIIYEIVLHCQADLISCEKFNFLIEKVKRFLKNADEFNYSIKYGELCCYISTLINKNIMY